MRRAFPTAGVSHLREDRASTLPRRVDSSAWQPVPLPESPTCLDVSALAELVKRQKVNREFGHRRHEVADDDLLALFEGIVAESDGVMPPEERADFEKLAVDYERLDAPCTSSPGTPSQPLPAGAVLLITCRAWCATRRVATGRLFAAFLRADVRRRRRAADGSGRRRRPGERRGAILAPDRRG